MKQPSRAPYPDGNQRFVDSRRTRYLRRPPGGPGRVLTLGYHKYFASYSMEEGAEQPAQKVDDTFAHRLLTLLALKTTAKFFSPDGVCFPITRTKIVKTGPYVHLTEASTMRFVAENTTIPVPQVYCAFVYRDRAYIVMERIQGEEIPKVWAKLSKESRQKILLQLKRMLQELRALKPPP